MPDTTEFDITMIWFVALLGIYLWSFWLCTVTKIRMGTLEDYCKLIKDLPPQYDTLVDNNLPSYQEALQ